MGDRRHHPLLSLVGSAVCLCAAVCAVAVLLLAIGAMADPTSSYYANLASSLWTTFGPHFGLLALVALVGAIVFGRWTPRWIARATIALSGIAVAGVAFIVGSIVSATVTAGGQANPITGLSLGKMSEPPPDQTETFTTVQGMPLEVAIYSPGAQHQRTDGPVLVYIHGGGFMIGTKTETAADLRWFADQGWAVFSIDYRLFGNDNPTWDKAPVDVACGLAWVGANAASHGGRDGPIVLMGDSAGGNLAINLAYSAALGQVRSTCGTVPTPAAVVVQYPAVDPVATYERGYPVAGFEPQMLMRGYVGGTPTEFPDRIKAISSETYLSNKAPPTLIIEPEKDGLVVSDGVYRFFDKAKAAGIDISMVRIPFANHVYNQIAWNSIGNQARRTITEHYLQSHGLAP